MKPDHFELVIVGGGLVGAALAFGLRALGRRLLLLDEGDVALRAARGNFGLIWVQGKGLACPAYGSWTQRSAREWPRLAAELAQVTGIDVALRQGGGMHVCLSRAEFDARAALFRELFAPPAFERYDVEFLDRAGVARRLGTVGGDVAGGTWSALDGDCNPMRLLRALHAAIGHAEVTRRSDAPVLHIEPGAGAAGFTIITANRAVTCDRVVLAAGLSNAKLAPLVGLTAPVTPNKGQIVVLERVERFLDMPLENIRQTDEGTVMIGDSQQDAGLDDRVEPAVTAAMAAMAARALRIFPFLRDARVVRTWAALRVLSPDGFPVYAQSARHPGAFVVTCHSGVTLAAAHALLLAPMIAAGALASSVSAFATDRFDVRSTA